MSTDDKVAISFDENGVPNGTLNFSEIQRFNAAVTKAAVMNIGTDRVEFVNALLTVCRNRDETEKYFALVGALHDLADILDSCFELVEAQGIPARAKMREIWGES